MRDCVDEICISDDRNDWAQNGRPQLHFRSNATAETSDAGGRWHSLDASPRPSESWRLFRNCRWWRRRRRRRRRPLTIFAISVPTIEVILTSGDDWQVPRRPQALLDGVGGSGVTHIFEQVGRRILHVVRLFNALLEEKRNVPFHLRISSAGRSRAPWRVASSRRATWRSASRRMASR